MKVNFFDNNLTKLGKRKNFLIKRI